MQFASKRDWTLPLIWIFVFFVYAAVGVFAYFHEGSFSELGLLFAVWIVLGLFFYTILKTTYYTITETQLVCHFLGFKKRIDLDQIRKIEPQHGLYAGLKLSTAWKGIVVHYGKWDEILISPADETAFIQEIKQRAKI
jgi:hypothetical protein